MCHFVSQVFNICVLSNQAVIFILFSNNFSKILCNNCVYKPSYFSSILSGKFLGTESFDFTCLLHTYFRVPDVSKVAIKGLSGITYADKVNMTNREISNLFPREFVYLMIKVNSDKVIQ